MAAVAPQSVQEILLKQGTVPKRYIQQNGEHQDGDRARPLPLMEGPTIDFSLLSNPQELEKLHYALSSWGCAQIVNHGIASSFLDEVREMSKEFFKLPIEEKEKYSWKDNAGVEGYGNDMEHQETGINWNDRLHLQVHPEQQRQLQYWPENPQNFRKTLHEYSIKTRAVFEALLKALERSLKLEENKFSELWHAEEDTIHARFNFYPRCPNSDLVVGLKPHGDGTVLTTLLQDKEVEALRVFKDHHWFRVPVIPEALVILVGDQMEIASNGIFKSPLHKVMVNPQHDRISLAMLPLPNREKEIGPLRELINEERPQLYKRFKDYGQVYFQPLAPGERPLSALKISY